MIKFRKLYNLKIVLVFAAVVLLITSAVFGIDLPNKFNLRLPFIDRERLSSLVKKGDYGNNEGMRRIDPFVLKVILEGLDPRMYEELRELVFHGNSDVSAFLREQAALVKKPRFPYTEIKEATASKLFSCLDIKETTEDKDTASITYNIKSTFSILDRLSVMYVSRYNTGENEYTWLSYFAGKDVTGDEQFYEEFYLNNRMLAHGFSNEAKDFIFLRMGIDNVLLRHKGHMQVLFSVRQSVFEQVFNPVGFVVPSIVIPDWNAFFFYVRKGYLPINSDARKTVIDKFLTPWLMDRDYKVEDPEEKFGKGFIARCGNFVLFLREHGYLILETINDTRIGI